MQRWLVILSIALLGCGFCSGVYFEQRESQRQLTTITSDWSATYQLQSHFLGAKIFALRNEIERYKHDIWHLQQKQDQYYEAWQDTLTELINSELYELAFEVSDNWGSLRSYRKVDSPPATEVIKYRNIFPRQFESIEQFEEWYGAQEFKPLFPSGAYQVDCNDYAGRLQRVALQQGYPVSQALVLDGRYYGIRVSGERDGHTGNLVLIGNTYYYIEPEPEKFKVVELVEKD